MITAFDSDQWIREQLGVLAIKAHKTPAELAKIAGICRASYYNRLQTPEDFTIRELRKLERVANKHHMSVLMEEQ